MLDAAPWQEVIIFHPNRRDEVAVVEDTSVGTWPQMVASTGFRRVLEFDFAHINVSLHCQLRPKGGQAAQKVPY